MSNQSGRDGGGTTQYGELMTFGADTDTMRAQLRALPAEALAAMLRQQISHTQALQRSNAEILTLVRRRGAGKADGQIAEEDDGVQLDDEDVVMLRETVDENMEVIKRKCDLAVLMYNILLDTAGQHGVSSDLTQDVEALQASTSSSHSVEAQPNTSAEGMYL